MCYYRLVQDKIGIQAVPLTAALGKGAIVIAKDDALQRVVLEVQGMT